MESLSEKMMATNSVEEKEEEESLESLAGYIEESLEAIGELVENKASEDEIREASYECIGAVLDLIDELNHVKTALCKKTKIKLIDAKKWLKEKEESEANNTNN